MIIHPPLPIDTRITDPFSSWSTWRLSLGLKRHSGIDLAVVRGTAAKAAAQGTVENLFLPKTDGTKDKVIRLKSVFQQSHTFSNGQVVVVPETFWFLYLHMDEFEVEDGSWIKRGATIGRTGRAGTGDHLHFTAWTDRFGDTVLVDPASFRPEWHVKRPAPHPYLWENRNPIYGQTAAQRSGMAIKRPVGIIRGRGRVKRVSLPPDEQRLTPVA